MNPRAASHLPRPVVILSWDHQLVREVREQGRGIDRIYLPASSNETLELATHPMAPLPALIIIDQGHQGLALVERLREGDPQRRIPLLLLLDGTTHEDLEAGYAAGADYALAKPLRDGAIGIALEQLLDEPPSGIQPIVRLDDER